VSPHPHSNADVQSEKGGSRIATILVLTDEQDRILLHERVDLVAFEDEHDSLKILER
jgi:hypothetical protein